ncbi:MAG: outer membrane beta-barrel protein [Kofleriaceae bacterium]
MRAFALLLVASTAAAEPAIPVTFGVSGGMTQSSSEAMQDPSGMIGLLVRVAGQRFGVELEMTKISRDQGDAQLATGRAVIDLASGRWVPQVFAGLGIDRASADNTGYDGRHAELGAGVEFRTASGFVAGARFHLGTRWDATSAYNTYGAPDCLVGCDSVAPTNDPVPTGQYRTLDLYAGVRF